LICLTFFLVSCSQNKETGKKETTILSGKIMHPNGNIFLVISANAAGRDTINVTNKGTFSDTLTVGTGYHLFSYGPIFFRAYVENGKKLTINFDAQNFRNSIQFKGGEVATINQYIIDKG